MTIRGSDCSRVSSANGESTGGPGSAARNGTNATPTKVVIYSIHFAPEPIGVGRYTGEICAHLIKKGIQVDVITAVPHYPGWKPRDGYRNRFCSESGDLFRITHCPLLLRTDMRGIWRILAPLTFAITSAPIVVSRILRVRPATVLCVEPTLLGAPLALLAAKLVGARAVLHVQDLEMDAAFAVGHLHSSALRRIACLFEKLVLRSFDAIITISNRMRLHLELKGVPSDRLSVVRNWVDLAKIKPSSCPSTYRKELGFSENDFVALYAGNIGLKQGLSVVLDAAERLPDLPGLRVVIVGDGPEKKRLTEAYRHLTNVHFLPVQPERRLCELLNFANVHLLPQSRDIADLVLPSKLGGMLASGKPCVVMADPSTELYEFLGDGAYILPAGDSAALAATISRLYHGVERTTLGDNRARLDALDASRNLECLTEVLI